MTLQGGSVPETVNQMFLIIFRNPNYIAMKRYILHIGYSKTGTSAIQHYLSRNRELLKKQKILYPDIKLFGVWAHCQNHNMLGRALAGRLGWYGLPPREYFKQFENQSNENNIEKVILSAESFLGGVQPWDYENEDQYWDASEKFVKKLGSFLSQHDVKIIIYLRRQDHWLESALNQTIKFGGLMADNLRMASINKLIDIYSPRLNYLKVLNLWSDVFGAESIQVGVYEKDRLMEQDIITDFCHSAGIDSSNLLAPVPDKSVENKSISRNLLEFKRILNAVKRPKYQERVIAEILFNLSSKYEDNFSNDYPLLDKSTRLSILQKYKDSNQEIAKQYLQDDGALFREPLPALSNGEPETYSGLSTEDAVLFLLELDRYLSLPQTRFKLFRHWLAERLRSKSPFMHALFRKIYYLTGK